MSRQKPGLGRGLDALLSVAGSGSKQGQSMPSDNTGLKQISVERIRRGRYQPRTSIRQENLAELADSIRAQGVVQPIVVRPIDGGYELIAGERRWRACQLAGLQEIPAVIREIPDQAAAAVALIENIQREELNPLEESGALQRLIDEFGLTHRQAADAVGRSRTAVTNLLRLQELEPPVKTSLSEGHLEMGHARALLALSGNEQAASARHVVDKGLSVRETERYIRQFKTQKENKKSETRRSPDVIKLENDLADRMGAPVNIQYNHKGKGKLVISYNDLDELDGILAHIK